MEGLIAFSFRGLRGFKSFKGIGIRVFDSFNRVGDSVSSVHKIFFFEPSCLFSFAASRVHKISILGFSQV